MNQKLKERYRIAFGLDARPRAQALKAWHAKWDGTTARPAGASWYKAVGGVVQPATKATKAAPAPLLASFGPQYTTDYSVSVGGHLAEVQISSAGGLLTAGGADVVSVKAAGVDRYAGNLVELETADGRRYRIAHQVLKKG